VSICSRSPDSRSVFEKIVSKDVMLKDLPEGGVIDFATHPIPSDDQINEAKAPKKKAKGN
jgi:hypothetical protein